MKVLATDRILIFVVAYNAGNHIRQVLDRLPVSVFNHPSFHILIIDDCSSDTTATTASAHVSKFQYNNVTVLRNPINQGYGGNQKLGYRYAVENSFDFAILLHGDGQYAPELVLDFVKSWKENSADVVLGSRMLDKEAARRGGMPFYKWVGNQILTHIQNWMVESKLSEFHTGYRGYATSFLKKIPFELNTNDFHFDTEILLQGMACNAKFVEFPIPTHYGDEICHVNGMRYAKDVIIACTKYKFQKIGFFCSMQYRGLLKPKDEEKLQDAVNQYLSRRIESGKKVLDLSTALHDFEVGEASKNKISQDIGAYDYVIGLDLLERFSNPERALIELRYHIGGEKQPVFLFSSGNVAFIFLRVLLSLGIFNYGERGVLNVLKYRLFTISSFKRMLYEAGYRPTRIIGTGLPFELLFPNWFGRALTKMSTFFATIWPSLFAFRFIVETKADPHTFMLLSQAETFYDTKNKNEQISP